MRCGVNFVEILTLTLLQLRQTSQESGKPAACFPPFDRVWVDRALFVRPRSVMNRTGFCPL